MAFKKETCVFIAALVAAAFLTGNAFAFKIGDFDIKPLGSVSQKYDDNITSTKTNKIHDYITDLSLGLNVLNEGKEQQLSLTGTVDHEFYNKHSNFDNTSTYLDGNYNRDLSINDRIMLSDSFARAETPTTFADQFGSTPGHYAYILNRFNAGYTRDITKQFSLAVGYANEHYDPSREGSSSSDQNSANLRANYAFSSATIVSGSYGYARRSFSPGGKVTTQTADAILRQFLTKQLYVDLTGGASFIHDVEGKNSTNPRYEVSIANDVTEKTTLRASFAKHYDSNYSSANVFNSWRTSFFVDHKIFERLAGVLELFLGKGEYKNLGIEDKFSGASARLSYELTKDVSAYVSYSRSQTNSNVESRDYTRNLYSLGIRVRF
jgi:hypothetical protein